MRMLFAAGITGTLACMGLLFSTGASANDLVMKRFGEGAKSSDIVQFLRDQASTRTRATEQQELGNAVLQKIKMTTGDEAPVPAGNTGASTAAAAPAANPISKPTPEAAPAPATENKPEPLPEKKAPPADVAEAPASKADDRAGDSACPAVGSPFAVDVKFAVNSAYIEPSAFGLLAEVAYAMRDEYLTECAFAVEGHTDSTGSSALNMQLSRQRAESVGAFLAAIGIKPERMKISGRGSDHPVDPNNPASATNRRVQFHVVGERAN